MLVFLSFIFLLAIGISILLITNKSEKAEEAKSILKEIFVNLKNLFINLKDLVVFLKDFIQNIVQGSSEEDDLTEVVEKPNEDSRNTSVIATESDVLIESPKETSDISSFPKVTSTQEGTSEEGVPSLNEEVESIQPNEKVESNPSDLLEEPKTLEEGHSQDIVSEISNKNEDIAS